MARAIGTGGGGGTTSMEGVVVLRTRHARGVCTPYDKVHNSSERLSS